MKAIIFLLTISFSTFSFSNEEERMAHFVFEATFTKEAVEWILENPQDRSDSYQKELEKLGGNLLGYYYYPGDSRMLAIIQLPSTKVAAVHRYQRQVVPLVENVKITEIIPSSEMTEVFIRAKQHNDAMQEQLKSITE